MIEMFLCPDCKADLTGKRVQIQDIALIKGRLSPVNGEVKVCTSQKLDISEMVRKVAKEHCCNVDDVKISLKDFFKVPGEALLEIGYGMESCGIICPICGEIIWKESWGNGKK